MDEQLKIFLFLLFGVGVIGIAVLRISMFFLNVRLYFLSFNLSKHPYLVKMINDTFYSLAENEGVKIFIVPSEKMNEEYEKVEDYAAGIYIHINKDDIETINRYNELYQDILRMEKKYKMPYEKLQQLWGDGKGKTIRNYSLCIPRIMLSQENFEDKKHLDMFYKTFAHELGHHYGIIYFNDKSEEKADELGCNLIQNNLPDYFKLIYESLLTVILNNDDHMLTEMKKYKAYWNFWSTYYRKKDKLNKIIEDGKINS